MTKDNPDAKFICSDFVTDDEIYSSHYDYIYSRFTIHAINDNQQEILFKNILKSLNTGGKIFIEARTIHDDLYGKGKHIAGNAYIYNNHYRRFIDPERLKSEMTAAGFEIISFAEQRGFSKTIDSDPVLLRLTAKLKSLSKK